MVLVGATMGRLDPSREPDMEPYHGGWGDQLSAISKGLCASGERAEDEGDGLLGTLAVLA